LVYSREAIADLVRLRDFIATHDPAAAARTAADLIARIDHLCRFPGIGRNVPDAPSAGAVRDFIFGKYIVRYAAHSDALSVLRIWHHCEGRQDSK
jgi:plasmid stabilization system protein ParE